MCENNNTARFLKRKELYIDAPITETMSILRIVLEKAGFREGVDMLEINNQYKDQYTTVRITKTVPYCNLETGKQTGEEMRYFDILLPDRYVPSHDNKNIKRGKIVRTIEDVKRLNL